MSVAHKAGTFFVCSSAVVDELLPTLGGSAVKVYLFLCRKADGDSGESYYPHSRIAKDCGISERSVRYAITELVTASAIKVTPRRRQTSIYQILYPAMGCQIKSNQGGNQLPDKNELSGNGLPDKDSYPAKIDTVERQPIADNQETRTRNKNAGVQESGSGQANLPLDVDPPPAKPAKKSSAAKKSKADPPSYPPGFREWYAKYPRHDKPARAATAFEKAQRFLTADEDHPEIETPEDARRFLESRAEAYAAYRATIPEKNQYIPYPATWLNDHSFDGDESKPAPPPLTDVEAYEAVGFKVLNPTAFST
ncbi:MAG: helix-turn-helix domain-containing protein [Pirellulaceae bacterium]